MGYHCVRSYILLLNEHFEIVCSHKLIRSLTDIFEHICQIKRTSANMLTSISLLVSVVIKGLMILKSKCYKQIPKWYDRYMKYEEAKVDRLAILQNFRDNEKNNN